jgi:hypothetical protein
LAISDNQGSANTGSTKIPINRSPHPRMDTLLRHEDTAHSRIAIDAAGLIHLRIAPLGKAAATVVFLDGPDATAPSPLGDTLSTEGFQLTPLDDLVRMKPI